MDESRYEALVADDLEHWVHPLFHTSFHEQPVLFERGEGIYVYGADGTATSTAWPLSGTSPSGTDAPNWAKPPPSR